MDHSTLLPGERLREAHGYQALSYFRPGHPDKPVIVFLPGGGHLARIAYGDPALRPDDFLDHWLDKAGYGLIALSYPSDHRLFERARPELTATEWAQVVATLTRQILDEAGLDRRIVILGWSMAGYVAPRVNRFAIAQGLAVEAFFSLAATPPLFVNSGIEAAFRLSPEGFRQMRGSTEWINVAIAEQAAVNSRPVFDAALYETMFRVNHPLNINGGQRRWRDGGIVTDIAEAIADLGSFEYENYPLTVCLIPQSINDMRHAFTDASSWTFLNFQSVFRNWATPEIQADSQRLTALGAHLSAIGTQLEKLKTSIPGGHLFFTGALGAKATVEAIGPHLAAIRQIRAELHIASAIPT